MKLKNNTIGISLATVIQILWLGILIWLLRVDSDTLFWYLVPGILVQTMLFTGLFITAHDAMHGTVAPNNEKLNTALGAISVFLYALFFYGDLKYKHQFHHDFPGSQQDPDFHSVNKSGFFAWYFSFIKNYLRWPQIIGMAIIFNILHHIFKIPLTNLLLFWVLPSLLSTLQLFYFGTFLPHRETDKPFPDRHRANSLNFGVFMSFISCYHFGGYHHEHHLKPSVAWWQLPKVRN